MNSSYGAPSYGAIPAGARTNDHVEIGRVPAGSVLLLGAATLALLFGIWTSAHGGGAVRDPNGP